MYGLKRVHKSVLGLLDCVFDDFDELKKKIHSFPSCPNEDLLRLSSEQIEARQQNKSK